MLAIKFAGITLANICTRLNITRNRVAFGVLATSLTSLCKPSFWRPLVRLSSQHSRRHLVLLERSSSPSFQRSWPLIDEGPLLNAMPRRETTRNSRRGTNAQTAPQATPLRSTLMIFPVSRISLHYANSMD